jgi:hypothetical protein
MAVDIGFVVPVKIRTGKKKRGSPPSIILDPDPTKITALAQKKCPSEDIRGL